MTQTSTISSLFPLTLRAWQRRWPLAGLAVLTLALAVAAATSLFSVVRIALLAPLPYPQPEELVVVWETQLEMGLPQFSVAPPNFVDWQRRSRSFEHLAAFQTNKVTLSGIETPRQLSAREVTGDYFATLGAVAMLGRLLTEEDARPGAPPVTVLSESLWLSQFGGRSSLIGENIILDGAAHTVLGVSFDEVRGEAELWLPSRQDLALLPRDSHYLRVLGRLKQTVDLATAQGELREIADRLAEEHPETNGGWQVSLQTLQEATVGSLKATLLALQGSVVVLFLIACANLTSLHLTRLAARSQELAMRRAVGASSRRLALESLWETLWLALPGGLLGLALAAAGTRLLVGLYPGALPRRSEIAIDGSVALFALAATLVATLLSWWLPALVSSRQPMGSLMKFHSSPGFSGRQSLRLRTGLAILQLGLALPVVTAAALLAGSLWNLHRVDPGFHAEDAWILDLNLTQTGGGGQGSGQGSDQGSGQGSGQGRTERLRQILERTSATSRSQALGVIFPLPLAQRSYRLTFLQPGQEQLPPQEQPIAAFRWLSEQGFEAMGIPLLRGRGFRPEEAWQPHRRVTLVNEKLADRLWPGESALDQTLLLEFDESGRFPYRVIGVTKNLRSQGLEMDPDPEIYLPIASNPEAFGTLVWRPKTAEPGAAGLLREALRKVDPNLPTFGIRPLSQVVNKSLGDSRFLSWMTSAFGAISLALAAIGVFGVIALGTRLRRREFGIRMALGAESRGLFWAVLRRSLVLAVAGLALGLAVSYATQSWLATLLYEITPMNPMVLLLSASLLFIVALGAGIGPALQAMRTKPAVTLREE